jgi:hypothetical protein
MTTPTKTLMMLAAALLCTGSASADQIILHAINVMDDSGSCGTYGGNLTWTFRDSTLTISGTGTMADYNKPLADRPWEGGQNIKTLVIGNGVISIGKQAFSSCSGLATVSIAGSVTGIGNYAFSHCHKLTSVTIPSGVISIGWSAFSECSALTTVSIPSSVIYIDEWAFYNGGRLTSITNLRPEPQTINANVFEGVDTNACTLYVPQASVAAYRAAAGWKAFGNIKPLPE